MNEQVWFSTNEVLQNIDPDKVESVRRAWSGVTLKEALATDQLSGFIADVFTTDIVALGLREATARNNFSVIGQSSNSDFKVRFRERTEGAQILRELDEFKHARSTRDTRAYTFVKIADSFAMSNELIMDSTLDEVNDELTLSASKIWRRENQLMWNILTQFSQGSANTGAESDIWSNYISGPACQDASTFPDNASAAEALLAAMQEAYLSMTTALTDRFDPSGLRWYMSPEVFTILWSEASVRRFDIMGSAPVQITGNLPNPFGVPVTIVETGYFNKSSDYVRANCDIYLVSSQFAAAIRERVGLTIDAVQLPQIQAQTPQVWERLIPYVRNPVAYRRISPSEDYNDQIPDSANIKITVKSE